MKTEMNPVGWFEIYTSDLGRAKAFYEATFELTLEKLPAPEVEGVPPVEMFAFPSDMEKMLPGACGAICKMDGVEPGAGGTLVYFSCEDCAETAKRAELAGGSVVAPKFSIGQYGFISMVIDTEGNTIGLHSQS